MVGFSPKHRFDFLYSFSIRGSRGILPLDFERTRLEMRTETESEDNHARDVI